MIEAAGKRIAGHVRMTPVMTLDDEFVAGLVDLKLELVQHAGSFKPRGAFNSLLVDGGTGPVAAASGGNHGAAVAYAAMKLDRPATIFVPEIASPAKIAAIRSFGADVRVGGARYADALVACEAFVKEAGATSVHAYDTVETIAGQGTLAREWEQQSPNLDTVLVAVGGGGLIAGVAAWWSKRVKVVGVEPVGSRALHAAIFEGKPVDVEVNSIAADSLGARSAGKLAHAISAVAVHHVTLVEDAAIADAQKWLWTNLRIATEPGGAAAMAALISGAYRPMKGERVGILLCGANVDLKSLSA
jgi:threonine dehydratase